MPRCTLLFAALLALGLSAAAAFHSTGALDAADAHVAAAARGASLLDPPLRITSRVTGGLVQLMRSMEPTRELFPLVHIAPGLAMALVAACSGAIAFRTASAIPWARVAAGIAVGTACLFGADLGAAGRAAGPISTILGLLSGACVLWIASKPRAFAGGLLVGLAVVEHPFVLFVLPGLLMVALGAAIREEPGSDARILRRAGIGCLVGLTAVFLEGSGAHLGALAGLAPPSAWIPALFELWKTLWRATGPIGLALALWGFFAWRRGEARHARPFLLLHFIPALAAIFVASRDAHVLRALAAWPFVFFMVPGIAAIASRWNASRPRALPALPVIAAAAAAALFVMNRETIDRRAERGIAWARDAMDRLTPNAVLLTANPVHWALVADGERPDLDVVLLDRLESVKLRRSTFGLFAPEFSKERDDRAYVFELISMNLPHRPVFMDPTIFFDLRRRAEILGESWQANPFGLSFRIASKGERPTKEEATAAAILWDEYELEPGTPPSALRGGLGGDEYYARSLLQSAALFLDMRLRPDAEREFLFALSLDAANPNAAVFGLGRIFLERQSFEEAVNTIEPRVQRDRDGAWLAYKTLGIAALRLGDLERGKRALRAALELMANAPPTERESTRNLLRGAEEGRALPGRAEQPLPADDRER
jgi:hypothetical protein